MINTGQWQVALAVSLLLSACSSVTEQQPSEQSAVASTLVAAVTPEDLPASRYGNPETYTVFGRDYHVKTTSRGYQQRGMASWYGPKFHGKRTSSGTPYDMHQLTAAHKSLPIPTFVQVTRLDNGRSIIVKVNDRGPFVDDRVIDLSYAAAHKLDMVGPGTAPVEVKALPPYQYLARHEGERIKGRALAQTVPASAVPAQLLPLASTHLSAGATTQAYVASPSAELLAEPLLALPLAAGQQRSTEQAAVTRAADSAVAALPVAGARQVYLQAGAFAQRTSAERLHSLLSQSLAWGVLVDSAAGEMHRVQVGPLQDSEDVADVKLALAQLGIENAYLIKQLQ
jgi:rare lipoprotein A